MISTADDAHFKIWDMRSINSRGNQSFTMTFKAGESSLCVGQFNPINEFIFAVAGDSNGNISLWDTRMVKNCLHEFSYHSS